MKKERIAKILALALSFSLITPSYTFAEPEPVSVSEDTVVDDEGLEVETEGTNTNEDAAGSEDKDKQSLSSDASVSSDEQELDDEQEEDKTNLILGSKIQVLRGANTGIQLLGDSTSTAKKATFLDGQAFRTAIEAVAQEDTSESPKYGRKDITSIIYWTNSNTKNSYDFWNKKGVLTKGTSINPSGWTNIALDSSPYPIRAHMFANMKETNDNNKDYSDGTEPSENQKKDFKPVLVIYSEAVEIYAPGNGTTGGDYSYMFEGMSNVTKFDTGTTDILSKLLTDNATDMHSMFSGCKSATTIDISTLATTHIEDMSDMFNGCEALTDLKLADSFTTAEVKDMSGMFNGCIKFSKGSIASNWSTDKVETMEAMFKNTAINSINLDSFKTTNLKTIKEMFSGCASLVSFAAPSSFKCESVTNIDEMFYNCINLANINMENMKLARVTSTTRMLNGCNKLEWLKTCAQYPTVNIELPSSDYYKAGSNTAFQQLNATTAPVKTYVGKGFITITFNSNTGQGTMPDQYTIKNVAIELNENQFTLSGYAFGGWSLAAQSPGVTTKKYSDTEAITIDQDTELYAVWVNGKQGTTFHHLVDTNGDGVDETETKEFTHGSKFGNLPNSKKTGYNVAWNTQRDGSGETITADTICTFTGETDVWAIYSPITYHVHFNENGSSDTMPDQYMKYDQDYKLSKCTMKRNGYTFAGWGGNAQKSPRDRDFYDQQTVKNLARNEGDTYIVYAIWAPNNTDDDDWRVYNIEYELDGGYFPVEVGENPTTYTKNSRDILLNNPVKDGSQFLGWSGTDLTGITNTTVIIKQRSTGDRKYKANWSTDAYLVDFVVDGNKYTTVSTNYGKYIKAPEDPKKANYEFIGWYKPDGTRFNFNTDKIFTNLTLTARFSRLESQSGVESYFTMVNPSTNEILLVKGQKINFGESGWTSSDPKLVKINNKGIATVKNTGNVTLTGPSVAYNATIINPSFPKELKKVTLTTGDSVSMNLQDSDPHFCIAWQASNPKVATAIDGRVYAIGVGSSKIYAYINGKKYITKVKVTDKAILPKKFKDTEEIDLFINQSFTPKFENKFKLNNINVEFYDADGKRSKVSQNNTDKTKKDGTTESHTEWYNTWVKVTDQGKITGRHEGKTKVVLKKDDNTRTIIINVLAKSAQSEIYVNKGSKTKLKISGIKMSKVKWTVSEDVASNNGVSANITTPTNTSGEHIATIDKNGAIKGLEVGDVILFGDYKGNIYETKVHVVDPTPVTDDILTTGSKKDTFKVTLSPNSAYSVKSLSLNQLANWKSSKPLVATVDEYGTIRAKTPGKAKISTKINGKTIKIEVVVQSGAHAVQDSDDNYKVISLINDTIRVHVKRTGQFYIEYV